MRNRLRYFLLMYLICANPLLYCGIPNVIQKLGIWQGGRANFFLGASDHCASTRCERKKKICNVANAAKNQFSSHVRYIAALESSDRNALEKQSPRTLKKIDHNEQLSTDDIKKMSRAGLSDDTIIAQIHETKTIFYLSSADIVDLKKSGVSQKIINYMIQTGNK